MRDSSYNEEDFVEEIDSEEEDKALEEMIMSIENAQTMEEKKIILQAIITEFDTAGKMNMIESILSVARALKHKVEDEYEDDMDYLRTSKQKNDDSFKKLS